MTISLRARLSCGPRSALELDPAVLGLRRSVHTTSLGSVVVHSGRRAGGDATILVHGAAGSWTTWTPLLRRSDELGAPLTDVIALDLPGWGESPLPESRELDPAAISAVVAQLARTLGYSRWHVVGHSLGGLLALDLAVREPDATLSVALVSPTGPSVVDVARRPLLGGVRLPWFAGMLVAMRVLRSLGSLGSAAVALLHRAGILGPLSAPLFADRRHVDPSVVAALSRELRPDAFLAAARAARSYDLGLWDRVRCPVVSVRGERDVFATDGDTDAFRRRMPRFEETRLRGAAHFAAIERPGRVLEVIARERERATRAAG